MLSSIKCGRALACCGSKYQPTDDLDLIGCYVKRTIGSKKTCGMQHPCIGCSSKCGGDRGYKNTSPWQRNFRLRLKSSSETRVVTSSESSAESFSRNYRLHKIRSSNSLPLGTSSDCNHDNLPESARRRHARPISDQTRSPHRSTASHRQRPNESSSSTNRGGGGGVRKHRVRLVKRSESRDVTSHTSSVPGRRVTQSEETETESSNKCVQLSRTTEHVERRSRTHRQALQQRDTLRTHKEVEVDQTVLLAGTELEDNKQTKKIEVGPTLMNIKLKISSQDEMLKNILNIYKNQSSDTVNKDENNNNNKQHCNSEIIDEDNSQDSDNNKQQCNNENQSSDDDNKVEENDDNSKQYCNNELIGEDNSQDSDNNKQQCKNENQSSDDDNEAEENDSNKQYCNNEIIGEDNSQDSDNNKQQCKNENQSSDDKDEENTNTEPHCNNENNNTSSESTSDNNSESTEDSDVKNPTNITDIVAIDSNDLFTDYEITKNTEQFKTIDTLRRVEEWRQRYAIEHCLESRQHDDEDDELSMNDTPWKVDGSDIQLSTFCASLLRGVAADEEVINDAVNYISTFIWQVSRETLSNDDRNKTGQCRHGEYKSLESPIDIENDDEDDDNDDDQFQPKIKDAEIPDASDVFYDRKCTSLYPDNMLVSSSSSSSSNLDDESDQGDNSFPTSTWNEELSVERRRVSEDYSTRTRTRIFLHSLRSESSDTEDSTDSTSSSVSPTTDPDPSADITRTSARPKDNFVILRRYFAESEDTDESGEEETDGEIFPCRNALSPNETRTEYDEEHSYEVGVPPFRGVVYFIDDDNGLEDFMTAADRRSPLSDIEEVSTTSSMSTPRTSSVLNSVSSIVPTGTTSPDDNDNDAAHIVFENIGVESTSSSSDRSVDNDLTAPPRSPTSTFVEYQYSEMVTICGEGPSLGEGRSWQWIGMPKIDDLHMRMFGPGARTELEVESDDVKQSSKSTMTESATSVVTSKSYIIDPVIDRFIDITDHFIS